MSPDGMLVSRTEFLGRLSKNAKDDYQDIQRD